ncbi:hypothetical protein RCF19_29770 [Rhodococcus qingshengii]
MQPRHADKKPEVENSDGQKIRLSWKDILGEWTALELDFQDWGIDLESGVLKERSWRWMQARIVGLIAKPDSKLRAALMVPLTHAVEK